MTHGIGLLLQDGGSLIRSVCLACLLGVISAGLEEAGGCACGGTGAPRRAHLQGR